MNPNKELAKSRLLQSSGWKSCIEAHLLRATDEWSEAPEFRSQGHVLRRLFEDIGIDAVVCIELRPTVCLKDGRTLNEQDIAELRKKLWNLGATTLLVVERQREVQVFSTLAKPSKDDSQNRNASLTAETIESLEKAELALRIQQFVRRVETGAIYRDNKPLFNSKHSIDQSLLENLRAVRDLICPERSVDGFRRAHALIGKFLFSCYLLDRGIIGPAYLAKNGLLKASNTPTASNIIDLLNSTFLGRGRVLESLFEVLHRDFNGSLFGNQSNSLITDTEIAYLLRFLSGENLRTGQQSLFRLYDFSFIPVELISSIYQEFLGAEAEAEAQPTGKNQLRNHGQRTQGAYYTPPRLAELAVDIATEGWETLLDKQCLDPACGSGIFLVILFVRMAEEWRNRNPDASTERRYNELMRLFDKNLRGVDINPTACLVTCFSLYLAFLDQMEPKEIIGLRDALDRDARKKLLPRILWERGQPHPRPPHLAAIHELDFFELSTEPMFDLVIGNPPWVSRKNAPSAEAWLFSEKCNPAAKGLKKAERNQTLFPAKEVACAFMWKAGLHAKPNGRVCQVLPSRVFLSNNTDRFQAAWLQRYRLESVWLLADYSFVLFPGADCPSFIGRYHPRQANEMMGEFEFITPKVEWVDPREALIPVQPEDQKMLSEEAIIAAAAENKTAAAWKQNFWGTLRDVRLISRLLAMPRLSRLAKSPPKDLDSVLPNQQHQWFKGQGFQPAVGSTTKPEPVFWKPDALFLSANAPAGNLVLLKNKCEKIGSRYETGLHRSRSPIIYKAPLVLINQAYTKFLFSDFDVLFQDDFQSISAPKSEEDHLLFLTAVLASPLAQYLLFHTSANIGIERDKVHFEEVLELPFPLPEDLPNREAGEAVLHECANLLRKLKYELLQPENLLRQNLLVEEAKEQLNALVYKYFDICEWERYLIEDTVEIFRPSSTPGSIDSDSLITAKPSQQAHRKVYADTLVSSFRGWTRARVGLWAEGFIASKSGLAMITFGVNGKSKAYQESPAEDRVEEVLTEIRKTTARSDGTVFSCLRGFAFYEDTKVHLLKPLSRRHWTRTAALNDADEILVHMMKEDGWGA